MIDYDSETGYDDGYDDMLTWVIQEVIDSINDKRCTEATWIDIYEIIHQQDVESAYKEYLKELKTP